MTKDEFMTYVNYLNKLFKFEMPDKDILPAWYKPFEKTHIQIAKKMADMYFQEEEGRFKLSKLIQYKSRAMNGVTYNEPKNESKCKLCKGTGFIQVEVPYRNTYTIKWMFGLPEVMKAMHDMDIHEGSTVRVLQKFHDSLIISSADRKIVLGNEVADRIQV